MTCFSNLFSKFVAGHHDLCHLTLKLCDWTLFFGVHKPRYKNGDDLLIFICKNRTIYVCHACPGWAGWWAAARFVWIELFLLTIVFLQISVPALARPSHTRQLWNLAQEGRRVLENSLMQELITRLLPDLSGLTITAFLLLIKSKMNSLSKKHIVCSEFFRITIHNAL